MPVRCTLLGLPESKRQQWAMRWCYWRERSLLAPNTIALLNITRDIDDWDPANAPRLWRYVLHYFDDLNAAGARERQDWHRALIEKWVLENPFPNGTAWEPYPTSLRIVNWIKWSMAGHQLSRDAESSLALQCRWLAKNLEIHLLGNHLWANAKALIFAGSFFHGAEAQTWWQKGIRTLLQQLSEQILQDGGHFERSPMYHAILLEDVLDLINLSKASEVSFPRYLIQRLSSSAESMLRWLRVMSHPDGNIAFFNDAAFGMAPTYATLLGYAKELGLCCDSDHIDRVAALQESGYVRAQTERATLICDLAAVGPEYLPGHAHADTLSFEFSLDGHRIFVNSGTSTYETGALREFQRSTGAHNTVSVDGMNSTEVWHAFRVGRRASPRNVRWTTCGEDVCIEGEHNGFRKQRSAITHKRQWLLQANALSIRDHVWGPFETFDAKYHLHPAMSPTRLGRNLVSLEGEQGSITVEFEQADQIEIVDSHWYPEFGHQVPNKTISARAREPKLSTVISWDQ